MEKFDSSNPNLAETMKSHIIDLDSFGVWENDYERFFQRRCEAISKELEKRVIPRPIDAQGQDVQTDDFEDVELEQSAV
jgi:hypothetical protein